jgi:hypothetical protein
VALAGAIMPGAPEYTVIPSAHAGAFGVGIIAIVGSMLVLPSSVMTGWIVPSCALFGIPGVERGKAAALVGGPPGVELHTTVDELPTGDVGAVIPVALPAVSVGIVPRAVVVPVVPGMDDWEVIDTGCVPGVICPVGVEQVTTVPGSVGSEASGTGANVVSGTPG